MSDPTVGIDSTINSKIYPNGVGAITAASLASVLTAVTGWVYLYFAPVASPAFTGTLTLNGAGPNAANGFAVLDGNGALSGAQGYITASNAANGQIGIQTGNTTGPGILGFFAPTTNLRLGYIGGLNTATNSIYLENENGTAGYEVTGQLRVDGGFTGTGAVNYAPLASQFGAL